MRIESAAVALASAHTQMSAQTVRESLRVSVTPPPAATPVRDTVSLSPRAKATWPPVEKAKPGDVDALLDESLDPELRMVKALIERMFGIKIRIAPAPDTRQAVGADLPPAQPEPQPQADANQPPQVAVDFERVVQTVESETSSVQMDGVVKTVDGRAFAFTLNVSLSAYTTTESREQVHIGPPPTDPLVLNFAGTAAQLNGARFAFDLNSDGTDELMPMLNPGSGLLVLDKNGDGKVTSGSELFGPATGNGFAELAIHDKDANHWIDENDPVYSQLRVWTPGAGAGNGVLATLAEKQVGAIYLEPVASPFAMKDSEQDVQAQVRATSLYLSESGAAGSVQQLDLVV
jgi:hypothetical protein